MARVELGRGIAEDFERILEHLTAHDAVDAPDRIADIVAALDVLERNPRIGRSVGGGRRELVIGRRSRGYVALYRYAADLDTVFVLAIRSGREAGYAR